MSRLGKDILSEAGKVQSIWEEYKSDLSLNPIIMGATDELMGSLSINPDKYVPILTKINNFVQECLLNAIDNEYTRFMSSLSESLSEYSVDYKKKTNNKINTRDNKLSDYCDDDTKIIYVMLRNGLIDSNEVQSLLDNQNLELVTTANNLIVRCGGSELPSRRRRDVHETSMLRLEDFGTDKLNILECVNSFINDDVDLFPNSPSEVCRMIFPREEFNNQVLYSQDNFMPNLANYGILSATSEYIQSSYEVDDDTSIHILSSLLSQLQEFFDKYDQEVCIILYMATLMVLKEKIIDSEDCEFIRKELANAFSIYKTTNNPDSQCSKMISIPDDIKNFVTNCDGFKYDGHDVDLLFDDILSSIDEIGEVLSDYGLDGNGNIGDELGVSESSLRVEHGTIDPGYNSPYVSKVSEKAIDIHNELNQSLLEGDLNRAAESIALECALLENLDHNAMVSPEILNKVTEFVTLRRDISTYLGMLESVFEGNTEYLESARSKIKRLLS